MNNDKNPFLKLIAMTIRGILRIYDYICYRPKVIYTNKEVKKYIKDISAKIALEFKTQPTAPLTVVIKMSTPKLQFAIF